MNIFRYPHLLVVALSWLVMLPLSSAGTAVAATDPLQADVTGADGSQGRLQTRFVRDFGDFAGSDANAQSLYTGLRSGTRITLAAPATTTSSGTTTTPVVQFDPPTRPMGNGNVFISLALAKQQLANYGITEPSPQQLQAALTGGTIRPADGTTPVVLKGILVQRADGMGWGSIAKTAGMNLGKVVSGIRSGHTQTATGTTSTAGGGNTTVATAAGASAKIRGGAEMRSTDRGNSAYASSSGMVSATGSPVSAGFNTHAQGGGRAGNTNTGFTTTAGGGAVNPGRSSASPQGQGKGLIKQ